MLELEVPVNYDLSRKISNGHKVTVSSDDNKYTWTGTVNRKSEFIDPNTQSVSVFVTLAAGNTSLYKGMYLKAQFGSITYKDVMELPRNAVFNQDEVYYVDSEMKLRKAQIQIVKYNDKTLLLQGLPEGMKVVDEPLINVTENLPVEIINK
jgi:hypothetical protein